MAEHQLRTLPEPFRCLDLTSEAMTRQLAADLAAILKPGDAICLSGDLGAGKSTLSRALIRTVAADAELEVPSPTFTLVQTYDVGRLELSHFDLYRLEDPEELEELGLEDCLETGAALIEWPEKAQELLPPNALWLQISQSDEDSEVRAAAFFSQDADWSSRLGFTLDVRAFLEKAVGPGADRHFLAGDASMRTFETVSKDRQTWVLMRWPFLDNGVPETVRSYMEAVHLAQDCRSVLAVGAELRREGFHAPGLVAADPDKGLILSEDLGTSTIVEDGQPVRERYLAAVDVLAQMHSRSWRSDIPLPDGGTYSVPAYSTSALIKEASLFLDWYLPEVSGHPASDNDRTDFERLWLEALQSISGAQTGWVLRDFHSPNLFWQEDASGIGRIGLIDFQDTVLGPVAYDVASLLLDARTDISPELENELFDAYVTARQYHSGTFDSIAFSDAYAVMAAQRITKILGIFVRLARRDSKPGYLAHLPRMERYLDRVLENPLLSDLKAWYHSKRH